MSATPQNAEPLTTSPVGQGLCPARALDCRCDDEGFWHPHVHTCGVPGCGAVWAGEFDTASYRPIVLPTSWPGAGVVAERRPRLALVRSVA